MKRGTWYVSIHYYDWTGKNCRKVKRGFKTKREDAEREHHFRMKEVADLQHLEHYLSREQVQRIVERSKALER